VLAVAGLVTAVALAGIVDPANGRLRVTIDPSAIHLLPARGPEREHYERARQLFGAEEPFVVALGAEDVFAPDVLRRIAALTEQLEALDDIHHVVSLARAPDIQSRDGDLELRPLLDVVPEDAAARAALRARTLDNPLYRGALVAADGRTAALFAYPERLSSRDLLESGVADRVEAAARAIAAPGVEVFVSGIPFATAKLSQLLLRELWTFLPITVLGLGVVLAIAFRTALGALLPLATVGLATLWTLGAMGWMGRPLNLVTAILPPLVVTVGFGYAMHMVAAFGALQRQQAGDRPARRLLAARSVEETGLSILLGGLTTLAGFLSLGLSPIVAIRELGLFAVLGVALATLAALTLTPALLAVLPGRALGAAPEGGALERMAGALAAFDVRHRRLVIGVAALATLAGAFGARHIESATEFVGNLDPTTQLRADYEAINARLGGANLIQIVVESPDAQAFLEPANLRALSGLTDWLALQPEVGGAVSLADYVAVANRAMRDGDPAALRVPETRSGVGQLLLFGASEETKRLTDARYQLANVVVRASVGDSRGIAALVERVEERLGGLPEPLEATVTGNVVLFGKSLDDLTGGQWTSLGAALLMIYAALAALFTSLRAGFLALFPNLVPVSLYYGALGWLGVTLNPWTSLVGSIALGIASDDTIHTVARFNAEARRLGDEQRAVVAALRGLIRPVTFTLLGLCLGFGVLGLSDLRSQAAFGLLAAATLAVGWLVDMTVTPALCAGVRVVTLWDVLTLDLGRDPARTIPLFAGLSPQQMRIFVLLASVRRLREGEVLFRAGEPARHAYLVLDGRLEAYVARDGERIVLEVMERGDTAGEIGLFALQHSTDVVALADARLVRFDGDDLERVRRRSPRTAALLYRNLNRIQSARHLANTSRVR
jgi:predicted RND superfamily exporter protein